MQGLLQIPGHMTSRDRTTSEGVSDESGLWIKSFCQTLHLYFGHVEAPQTPFWNKTNWSQVTQPWCDLCVLLVFPNCSRSQPSHLSIHPPQLQLPTLVQRLQKVHPRSISARVLWQIEMVGVELGGLGRPLDWASATPGHLPHLSSSCCCWPNWPCHYFFLCPFRCLSWETAVVRTSPPIPFCFCSPGVLKRKAQALKENCNWDSSNCGGWVDRCVGCDLEQCVSTRCSHRQHHGRLTRDEVKGFSRKVLGVNPYAQSADLKNSRFTCLIHQTMSLSLYLCVGL